MHGFRKLHDEAARKVITHHDHPTKTLEEWNFYKVWRVRTKARFHLTRKFYYFGHMK